MDKDNKRQEKKQQEHKQHKQHKKHKNHKKHEKHKNKNKDENKNKNKNKNENKTRYNDKDIIMPFLQQKQDEEHAYKPSNELSEEGKKNIVNDFSHAFAVFSQFGNMILTLAFERFVNTVKWYSGIPPMLLRDKFKEIINPVDDEGNKLLPENASMSNIEQWFKKVLPDFLAWVEEHKDEYRDNEERDNREAYDEDYEQGKHLGKDEAGKERKKEDSILYR